MAAPWGSRNWERAGGPAIRHGLIDDEAAWDALVEDLAGPIWAVLTREVGLAEAARVFRLIWIRLADRVPVDAGDEDLKRWVAATLTAEIERSLALAPRR